MHKSTDEELYNLLAFFVLTDMRSLTSVENLKDYPNRVNSLDDDYKFPHLEHHKSINIIFSVFPKVLLTVLDLDYKLLKNNSDVAFISSDISSDYPISKYNLLFENQNKYFSSTGYKWKGLLVFIPISPSLTLVFFDKSTYKVGNKKETVISISNSKEVDQLNLLQVLHSNQIVFFNERVSKEYVYQLKELSDKYIKPNLQIVHKAKLIEPNGKEKEIVVNRNNSPNINLKISSIKIHSGSKRASIDPLRMNFRK